MAENLQIPRPRTEADVLVAHIPMSTTGVQCTDPACGCRKPRSAPEVKNYLTRQRQLEDREFLLSCVRADIPEATDALRNIIRLMTMDQEVK